MKKYMGLEDELNDLKVIYYKEVELTDESTIVIYTEKLLNNMELPANISFKEIEIDDLDKVKSFNSLLKEKKSLPKNVVHKEFENSAGDCFIKYFYDNRFTFIEKIYLEDDVVDFNLQVKQTEHLKYIAKSMLFFKILAWIGIISSVILIIIILNNANG
jgi:hypothetical protein